MNSTLSANLAPTGGGIYNIGSTLTVTNSTLSGNSASINGGGIYNNGTLTVTNSDIFKNSASTSIGGCIFNSFFAGTLTVINSTFSANLAYGGGILTGGTTSLFNTIVANSPSGSDCVQPVGTITADNYNIDTDGPCDNATQRTSTQINLQPLAD